MSTAPVTHGADVAALRAWGGASAEAAHRLEQTTAALTLAVEAFAWSGPDRARFAQDWHAALAPALRTVSGALQTASAHVGHDADQQESVSTDGGTLTATTGAPSPASDPAADAVREAREAAWARGAGRVLLGLLGSAAGGPAGAVIGAVAGPALVDRLVGVADERADRTTVTDVTDRVPIADTLPTSPGDLMQDMADMYEHEGALRLDLLTRPDGSQVALMYVPGTEDWSLDADGDNPMGAYGAVGAASGKDTPLRRLMLAAMDEVPEGVPIHIATHSQSGFAALDLAADPYVRARYDIASVVTAGTGGGNFQVPEGTTVVSVRNPFDPVARIGGAPEGAIDVTGTWSGDHPHSASAYADLLSRTSSAELDAWWRSVGIEGSTMQTRVLEATVAPAG